MDVRAGVVGVAAEDVRMISMNRLNCVIVCSTVVAVLLALPLLATPARAVAPDGACCLADLSCEDVDEFTCAEQGGQFIGAETSCANVQCRARVEAPVLSILGLVGVVGALAGLGIFRLVRKRR